METMYVLMEKCMKNGTELFTGQILSLFFLILTMAADLSLFF